MTTTEILAAQKIRQTRPTVAEFETALRVLRWTAYIASDANPSWHQPLVSICGMIRGFVSIAKNQDVAAMPNEKS
jgi:hypothetical protein